MTVERQLRHHLDRRDGAVLDLARREQLDHVEQQELRQIWWDLRRHGVQLPAERGVIAINGGRR